MFEISKGDHFYNRCQVCEADKSVSANINIYSIRIVNKHNNGVEIHLCSNCCNILSDLTKEPDRCMHGIKMMSVDELEELTNNTKCSII